MAISSVFVFCSSRSAQRRLCALPRRGFDLAASQVFDCPGDSTEPAGCGLSASIYSRPYSNVMQSRFNINISMQEVDHFKFLQTVLGSQNYAGIFFPKPDSPCLYIEQNNGPDGCAIFYKRDKLQLLGYDTRILEVWRVQSNQVAIAARLQLKSSGKEFCVCTTHLKARHGALLAKLRNEQGRDLIRFVKQFAGGSPLLLCGDFNAEPVEPIYATILGCDLFKLSSAYADMQLEREREREQDREQQFTSSCEDPNEFISQSIKREPPYTTWKIREDGEECHTIDYVFYTPQQLKVSGRDRSQH